MHHCRTSLAALAVLALLAGCGGNDKSAGGTATDPVAGKAVADVDAAMADAQRARAAPPGTPAQQ